MSAAADFVSHAPLPWWRRPDVMMNTADALAILIAISLPWSTSLVAIFAVAWLVALIPIVNVQQFLESLKRPICALPIAFFALAVAGMFWSEGSWAARTHAISPVAKLLSLPLLFYHFERSQRAMWVFAAFLIACTALMVLSWIVAFAPQLMKPDTAYGVPVKNYIDQGQEFVLCAVGLGYLIVYWVQRRRLVWAVLAAAVAAGFVTNMMFVTVSRTALVTMPILLSLIWLQHLRLRGLILAFCAVIIFSGAAWVVSPHLRIKGKSIVMEYNQYETSGAATSVGLRLEFWRKSLRFFAEAPLIGHGTGATKALFAQAANGEFGAASSEIIGNPHNQTLNVAVQWGAVGVLLLYAMWFVHLFLFRGVDIAATVGLLVVVQNVISSLFNSHLFDFTEGWIYVVGVGVAGGLIIKKRADQAAVQSSEVCRIAGPNDWIGRAR